MKRARDALEQGNTKFVARGENKELFEEMKREFEQKKNAQSDSKRMKLPAPASHTSSNKESDDPPASKSSSHEEIVNEAAMPWQAHRKTPEANRVPKIQDIETGEDLESDEENVTGDIPIRMIMPTSSRAL